MHLINFCSALFPGWIQEAFVHEILQPDGREEGIAEEKAHRVRREAVHTP